MKFSIATIELGILLPDGYPEPRFLLQDTPSPSLSPSSKDHRSIQRSLVTLAATLAALTILNFESALGCTVKLI